MEFRLEVTFPLPCGLHDLKDHMKYDSNVIESQELQELQELQI